MILHYKFWVGAEDDYFGYYEPYEYDASDKEIKEAKQYVAEHILNKDDLISFILDNPEEPFEEYFKEFIADYLEDRAYKEYKENK